VNSDHGAFDVTGGAEIRGRQVPKPGYGPFTVFLSSFGFRYRDTAKILDEILDEIFGKIPGRQSNMHAAEREYRRQARIINRPCTGC
jgi:hypothetical protein